MTSPTAPIDLGLRRSIYAGSGNAPDQENCSSVAVATLILILVLLVFLLLLLLLGRLDGCTILIGQHDRFSRRGPVWRRARCRGSNNDSQSSRADD
jgi:hypothetical protein